MATEDKKQFDKPSNIILLINKYLNILSFLIVIIVLILGFFILLQPKINNIQSTRGDKLPEVQRKEEDLRSLVNQIDKLKNKYSEIKSERADDLDKLYKILPLDPDIANLFLIADRLANEYGFKLLSIDMAEPDKKSIKKQKKEDGVIKKEAWKSLIIHMVVSQIDDRNDAYGNFKKYLSGLENNLRLIDIETVSFEGFTSVEESFPIFNFSLITYFNNQENEQKENK